MNSSPTLWIDLTVGYSHTHRHTWKLYVILTMYAEFTEFGDGADMLKPSFKTPSGFPHSGFGQIIWCFATFWHNTDYLYDMLKFLSKNNFDIYFISRVLAKELLFSLHHSKWVLAAGRTTSHWYKINHTESDRILSQLSSALPCKSMRSRETVISEITWR